MRALLLLSLLSGCGSIDVVSFQVELRDGFDRGHFERAADYWRPHGVAIEVGPAGSPFSVRAAPLPDNKGDGVTQLGEILIDPSYLDDSQLLAHELGHAIGLGHLHGCNVMSSPRECNVPELQAGDLAALSLLAPR